MIAPNKVAPIGAKDPEVVADTFELLKDSMGRFRTVSLFVETKHDSYPAPFTLKDRDHRGAISMYRKYMEIGDPTEYTTALELLGSWRHWQQLTKASWFQEYILRWREELAIKFEAERFKEMEDIVENHKGTPMAIQATKWLADRYKTKSNKPRRGRPSKEEKQAHLVKETKEDKLVAEEAERLGLL